MLKCRFCMHLIDGMKDEGPLGGGCDNVTRCRMRTEIEEMVRKELKFYGTTGTPCSTWLCGQTGIDENSLNGTDTDDDRVRVYTDDEGEEIEVYRDPMWITFDCFMQNLPKMEIIITPCRIRDELGQEIRHNTGRRFKKKPVAEYVRVNGNSEWLMRREKYLKQEIDVEST